MTTPKALVEGGPQNAFKALLQAVLTPAAPSQPAVPTLRERQEAGAEAAETLRNASRPR